MKIQVYCDIVDIESLNDHITFRTGGPHEQVREQDLFNPRFCGPLISYGFSGTVMKALEQHPDIVKVIQW